MIGWIDCWNKDYFKVKLLLLKFNDGMKKYCRKKEIRGVKIGGGCGFRDFG